MGMPSQETHLYDTQLRGPLQRPVLQHRWTGDASLANDPVDLVRLALTPPNRKHSHHENDRRVLLVAAPEHRVGRALLRILVSPVVPRHGTADSHPLNISLGNLALVCSGVQVLPTRSCEAAKPARPGSYTLAELPSHWRPPIW